MYFLVAMAVSFVTVFGSSLLGALIRREKVGVILGVSVAVTVVYGLVLWLIFWTSAIGIYGPTPLFWPIIIGAIIALIVVAAVLYEDENAVLYEDENFAVIAMASLPCIVVGGLYILYALFIVLCVKQSDIFTATEKAKLIGTVQTVADLNKVMEPADPVHICLVSEDMAKVSAQNALSKLELNDNAIPGSRYSIGEPTKQWVDGQLWWIFPLEFKGWLKWRQNKKVPGYLRVSAENPFFEGQTVQVDKDSKDIQIRYLNSACFEFRANRYLRENGYLNSILTDWTFEPNDSWRPFYTVSVLKRKFGFTGYETVGILTLDLQTGNIVYYDINSLPAWIDRAIPLNVIDYNIEKWGKYSLAGWWYCLWHDDKSQMPTPGWFLTYNQKGFCQWFSGFTSTSAEDQALTGFTLTNGRTGKTIFFKASGVTEEIAYNTAQSLWSNFKGYEPTELVPYNIYGNLTYVIPITYSGQFKGVSLAALNNVNIKAKGETIEEALSNYRAMISEATSDRLVPSGGELEIIELEGKIQRVGQTLMQGQKQIFTFMLENEPKIFQVVNSESTNKAVVMKPGDLVKIKYQDTQGSSITCSSFDIPAIVLSDTNPHQARYQEEQGRQAE